MRYSFFLFLLLFIQSFAQVNPNYHWVNGHTRSNGTYVEGHYRTNRNSTVNDNYSTIGNINPHTGKAGWLPRQNYSYISSGFNTINYDYIVTSSSNIKKQAINNTFSDKLTPGSKEIEYSNGTELFTTISSSIDYYKEGVEYFSYSPTRHEIVESTNKTTSQLLDGEYRFYDNQKTLRLHRSFRRGVLHGYDLKYDVNGKLKSEANYNYGNLVYLKFEDKEGDIIELTGIPNKNNSKSSVYRQGVKIQERKYYGKNSYKELIFDEKTGQKTQEYEIRDSNLHGKFYEYFEGGSLSLEGYFLNGVKSGKWSFYYLEETSETSKLGEYFNYKEDILHGKFQELKKDSIITGNYHNGLLHGRYIVYRPLILLFGVLPSILKENEIVKEGEYLHGQKNGLWKFYDGAHGLLQEGSFIDGKKIGEWKHYYGSYLDSQSNKLPYANLLYLIENYRKGVKYGKSERYSYLSRNVIKCDTSIGTNNPLDTCYTYTYKEVSEKSFWKNNQLHGPFFFKDVSGNKIINGNFLNGEKVGKWVVEYTKDNVPIIETSIYNNDTRSGSFVKKIKNGINIETGEFKDGEKHGEWITYYNHSDVYSMEEYIDGQLDGKKNVFAKNGVIEKQASYKSGYLKNLIIIDTVKNTPISKFEFLEIRNKNYTFILTTFSRDSIETYTLQMPTVYEDAASNDIDWFLIDYILNLERDNLMKIGEYSVKSQGKYSVEGTYNQNFKVGEWKFYYHKQDLIFKKNFSKGKIINEEFWDISKKKPYNGKFVSKNNNTTIISRVKKGVKNGKESQYDFNGRRVNTYFYENGIKQSK